MAPWSRRKPPAITISAPPRTIPGRGNTITAAARTVNVGDRQEARQMRALRQGWQSDAWTYRDAIGELRYAVNFLSNCAKRMRLYPAAYPVGGETDKPEPLDKVPGIPPQVASLAEQALIDLGHGKLALQHIMGGLSTNLSVAGECWLLGMTDEETGEARWTVRSVDELIIKDDHYVLREVPADQQGIIPWVQLDPRTTVCSRIWMPHPRFRLLADSPMRAMLDDCEGVTIYRRGIRATGRSRLATGGFLLMPNEVNIKPPLDDNNDPQADPFMASLAEAMMEPISDEGSASSVVPIVVRGPAEAMKEVRRIDMASTHYEADAKVREELIGIIATSFDLPKEVITGIVDLNHWCFDEESEVLTERGWLKHDEIQVGDIALSLNHDTGQSEWHPVTDVYRADVVDEPMLSYEHRLHSSLTTMEHKWPVLTRRGRDQRWEREWRFSRDFRTQDHLITAAKGATVPTIAKYSDAFVEAVAWLFTEGGIRHRSGRNAPQVAIYQSHVANRANCERIAAALTALHGPASMQPLDAEKKTKRPAWRRIEERHRTRFALNQRAAEPLVKKCPGRVVDIAWLRELTQAQLELFIDTAIRGDGTVNKRTGQWYFGQKERARVEPVAVAAILAGYSVTWNESRHEGFRSHVQHGITISKRTTVGMQRGRREVVNYTGRVWCPTVPPTHSVMVRRGNSHYFSGQSAWQVDDNTFRHHVEPHVIDCCDSLTTGYLQQYLENEGVDRAIARRVVVWYDATELVTHPDQTKDALDLHDRLVISDAALLRVAGFQEVDKPSKAEVQVRLLEKMRQWPPNLVMAFLHQWDPTLQAPPMTGPPAVPGITPSGVVDAPSTEVPGRGAAAELPSGGPPPAAESAQNGPPPMQRQLPAPPAQTASGVPWDKEFLDEVRALVAGVAPSPPNLRDATEDGIACSTCKMFNAGECWGYGNAKVQPTQVCDSYAPETVVAAATKPRKGLRASQRLVAIDQDLRARLQVAASAAMLRQLERAGERLRKKVARDERLRAKIAHQPSYMVAAALGPEDTEATGLTADQLLGKEWNSLKDRFYAWTEAAQTQAIKTARNLAYVDDAAVEQAEAAMAEGRDKGWAVLANTMSDLSHSLLYSPDPNDVGAALNPDTLVPTGVIRAALGLAGGNELAQTTSNGGPIEVGVPVGQIGTGATISELIEQGGGQREGWEWVHGPALNPFEPHEELDGVQFASFDSEALANNGDWPENSFYMPGDHQGCSCDYLPIFLAPDEVEAPAAEPEAVP